jgi:hypothetical protein
MPVTLSTKLAVSCKLEADCLIVLKRNNEVFHFKAQPVIRFRNSDN